MLGDRWEVVVIGGGHAGVEAALASARTGAETLLVTGSLATLAQMPCNPAVGGPAKGVLVREVDALGGEMGLAADATYLQLRMLNESKGPAVQALRAQSDKAAYGAYMQAVLAGEPRLELREAMIEHLRPDAEGRWRLMTAEGEAITAISVVVTTGTFMRGRCFTGLASVAAGRRGEPPAVGISGALSGLGFELHRLKTGTPPRVDAATVDVSGLRREDGEARGLGFSFLRPAPVRPQHPCYLTHTTAETHAVIVANLHRSPIYGGDGGITGVGPRYCPSIEDKVVRFRDKETHPIFLEPEDAEGKEIYVQGFSTSLPEEVQLEMVRSLPGLGRAAITRFGYAVEYDAIPATQLTHALMSARHPGLFCAGQINGTSGYEEAAAQGVVAGLNASRFARSLPPVMLPRSGSYIGTLVDDLVTKEIRDPYRMLTSRSEYRLTLRSDNADQRLTPLGRSLGLATEERAEKLAGKLAAIEKERRWLGRTRINAEGPQAAALLSATGERLTRAHTLEALLRRPAARLGPLLAVVGRPESDIPPEVAEQLAIALKYEGYIRRQESQIERQGHLEETLLPDPLDFHAIVGLSREAQDKLSRVRPRSLGQAARVGGVTPADVSLLLIHLEVGRRAVTT